MACAGYKNGCNCYKCNKRAIREVFYDDPLPLPENGGTFNSTAFGDRQQRNNPSVTNTYFNSGKVDGEKHGHVKYRNNQDGTTDYFYARDVEGNEYEV